MKTLLLALSTLFFVLGVTLIIRTLRAAPMDRIRYIRGSAGAFAAGLGNLLILDQPTVGLLFLLAGVWLIMTVGRTPGN